MVMWSHLTKFKVALKSSVRGVSEHNFYRNAERTKKIMGSEYHIYGWDSVEKKWVKI